ncbi:MAG: metallophosphoesterase [Oscillospiraceae bacterium]|nr:metallophosphoesterase [Oscillospiraceae bacterium]
MTKYKRSAKHIKIIIISLISLFLILSTLSFPLRTVIYSIRTGKVTKPVRIAQVSDLHSDYYGKNMKNLLNAIDEQSPDLIVLTGDIFDEESDNENTRIFLKDISQKYPCFYVSGNHEHRKNGWNTYKNEALKMGITVLEGDTSEIMGITICGASSSGRGNQNFGTSVSHCAEKAGDNFNVLLAHYPEQIDFYRSFGKFDLILSGHAHGGQWRIPFLVNGLYAPEQGLFPKYAGGRYDFENETMIVSRGLSRTKTKIPRIFNNPELVIIDIFPESEEQS